MLEKIKETQIAILGVCLLLGVVIASTVLSGALMASRHDDVLTVTGSASQMISSDHASWDCGIARQSSSLQTAYAALADDLKTVKAYLVKNGFAESDLQVSGIERNELNGHDDHGNATNQIDAYILRQTIHVESDDVKKIDAIARQSTELMAQGIGFTSNAPQYTYSKLDDMKIDMIGKATQNAKVRAESMAKNTGNEIGPLRSASTGVFHITAPNSTDVSDEGISDTSSIAKKITAVISATFAIR